MLPPSLSEGIPGLIFVLIRIAAVWIAFFTLGRTICYLFTRSEPTIEASLITGTASSALLALAFSVFGIMTRTVLASTIAMLCLLSIPFARAARRKTADASGDIGQRRIVLIAAAAAFALLPIVSTAIRAAMPHGFVDPLIIYAVRPDRWLDAGHISYLTETKFSGLPFLGEAVALWPAALSASRIDQLVCLQFFQFSMLFAAILIVSRIFRLSIFHFLSISCIVFASPLMSSWCVTAKTDMTSAFFTSCGLALAASGICREGMKRGFHWLVLGLGIATKLTAIVVLPAAILLMLRDRPSIKSFLFVPLALLPVLPFTIATFSRTGEPFYPFHLPPFEAAENYLLMPVMQLAPYMSRVHASLGRNLVDLLTAWGVFTAAVVTAAAMALWKRDRGTALQILGFLAVFAVTVSLVFNPTEWGAKYSVFALPFIAAWALKIANSRMITLCLCAMALLLSSPSGRLSYTLSFVEEGRRLDFHGSDTPPTLSLHEWCNRNLPEGTVLVSLWRPERYFSDHTVLVAQNNPRLIALFEENTATEEIEMLRAVEADYIYFNASDPMPGGLENGVTILGSIREGGPLEPVVLLDGYLLCRMGDATR